jgi:hypothetical protein
MAKQDILKSKSMGRPRTGQGVPVLVRLQPDQLTALDAFIAKQPKKVSRPEAIRTLVAEVLSNGGPTAGALTVTLRTLAGRARESWDEFADGDHSQSEELHDAITAAERLLMAAGLPLMGGDR